MGLGFWARGLRDLKSKFGRSSSQGANPKSIRQSSFCKYQCHSFSCFLFFNNFWFVKRDKAHCKCKRVNKDQRNNNNRNNNTSKSLYCQTTFFPTHGNFIVGCQREDDGSNYPFFNHCLNLEFCSLTSKEKSGSFDWELF